MSVLFHVAELTVALFFSPSILRTLHSGQGNGNLLVLSAGLTAYERRLMVGNNYGLGETRKKELSGACKVLAINRQDRCVVLDKKYRSGAFNRVLSGRLTV